MEPQNPQPINQPPADQLQPPVNEQPSAAMPETPPVVQPVPPPAPTVSPVAVPPAPSAFPQPAATPQASAPNSKKRLIAIVAAAGGVILLAIIAAILFVTVFTVSKQDYRDAYTQANGVTSAYNKIGDNAYVSSSSTDTQIKNSLDSLKEARQNFDNKLSDLGKTKAIKRDGDLKKLYSDITAKKPKFDKAMDAAVEADAKILPVANKINSLSYSSDNISSQISTAADQFNGIEGLKDDNNKQFVSKMASLLKKYATLAQKVQQGRDDYRKYDSKAVSDFYDTESAISDATRDWQSNLTKMASDGELQDQLSALNDKLFDKSLGSK